MGLELMRLAEVTERTGLSSSTIRGLERSRVVVPERALGPHRLYSPDDLTRLLVVKRMTALGFPPEEIRDLLEVVEGLQAASSASAPSRQTDLVDQARAWLTVLRERRRSVRGQVDDAEDLATVLALHLRRQGVAEPFSADAMLPSAEGQPEVRA